MKYTLALLSGLLLLALETKACYAATLASNTTFDDWSGISCPGETFEGIRTMSFNLSGDDLSNANLSSSTLRFVDLGGANLMGADLSSATIRDTRLENANLEGANLSGGEFYHNNDSFCVFGCGSWRNANFRGANLSGSLFARGASGIGVRVEGADFTGADLRGVTIGSQLEFADYTNALIDVRILPGGSMFGRFTSFNGSNGGTIGGDFSGGNHSITGTGSIDGNFNGASVALGFSGELRGTFISTTFSGSGFLNLIFSGDFTDSAFSGSTILPAGGSPGTIFVNAEFIDTTFLTGTFPFTADFSFADFRGAGFSSTNLNSSVITGADFSGADLSGALSLDSTTFSPESPPIYDPDTNFEGTAFDPVAEGWLFVPEPSRLLLSVLGLGAMLMRRRR